MSEPLVQLQEWERLPAEERQAQLSLIPIIRRKAMFRLARMQIRKGLEDALTSAYYDDDSCCDLPQLNEIDSRLAAMMHLLTVYLPCCIHFHCRPQELYKRVVAGNRRAWREMESLDPEVRKMPEIASQVREMIAKEDRFLTKPLASRKPTILSLDPMSAKILVMYWMRENSRTISDGFKKCDVSKFRAVFGTSWKPPVMFSPRDLRELYNAREMDSGARTDPHLCEIDDAALRQRLIRLRTSLPKDMWNIFGSLHVTGV